MKKIILLTPDFNTTAAALLIAIKTAKPSSTTIILSELIRLSENGIITSAASLHKHFSRNFSISHKNYIAITAKLCRLNLISRSTSNSIILCPELTSVSQITIKG